MAAEPLPTSLDDLPAWIARHYAPQNRAHAFQVFAPQVRAAETAGRIPARAPAAGVAASSAPAAAPAPTLPTSFGQEAGIQGYQDQISALPGTYNPQRLGLYTEGARGLTDQGYYDIAKVGTRTTAADGSTTYGVDAQGDGQRYRDTYNGIDAAANSRGALFGSATTWGRQSAQAGLNNARDAILRQLAGQQDQSVAAQQSQRATLGSGLATAQGDYADWRATQPVAPPAPASQATAAPTASGVLGSYNFAPNRNTLDRRYGAGKYRVTKSGAGKYIVTGA